MISSIKEKYTGLGQYSRFQHWYWKKLYSFTNASWNHLRTSEKDFLYTIHGSLQLFKLLCPKDVVLVEHGWKELTIWLMYYLLFSYWQVRFTGMAWLVRMDLIKFGLAAVLRLMKTNYCQGFWQFYYKYSFISKRRVRTLMVPQPSVAVQERMIEIFSGWEGCLHL